MKGKPKGKPKLQKVGGGRFIEPHAVQPAQVYPCICGVWFSTPTERQQHLDDEWVPPKV